MSLTPRYDDIWPPDTPGHTTEPVGSRRKFWIQDYANQDWLLKFPRHGTGEHWAEKVAAEIGRLFGVDTAQVELAWAGDQPVTICRSFLPNEAELENLNSPVFTWFQGSEFLDLAVPDYDVRLIRPNKAHNIKNIIAVVLEMTGDDNHNPMPDSDRMLEAMASYAILDGLIGNTDRHHENWMVILNRDLRMHVAPSYDHASSLGRELRDEHRERILASNRVLDYLKRGRGGVFLDEKRTQAPSPLYLAQLVCRRLRRWRPRLAEEWFGRLNSVPDTEFRSIIDEVPPELMSDMAKEFAHQVVVTSRTEILRSIR